MSGGRATSPSHGFEHPALFYRSDEEYLSCLLPFILEGRVRQEPVAAAVPPDKLKLLRSALSGVTDWVHLIDMTQAGRNPGRIIAGVLSKFADSHPHGRVRIIGEPIWPGRTAVEYPACVQHEALINMAFAERNLTIVCPYDALQLDPAALEDALATHPVVWDAGEVRPSQSYAPIGIVERYNQPLTNSADGVGRMNLRGTDDLWALRRFVTDLASSLNLGHRSCGDLELIVTELATNSLVHADGGCQVSIWPDSRHVICEVRDTGHLTDVLAGRRPATPDQRGGRGLLLVHQLADLVRVHTSREGTTVHAYLRLDGR